MDKQKEKTIKFNTQIIARTKSLGAWQNETLKHKTKGDADLNTHKKVIGEQMETIRDQG